MISWSRIPSSETKRSPSRNTASWFVIWAFFNPDSARRKHCYLLLGMIVSPAYVLLANHLLHSLPPVERSNGAQVLAQLVQSVHHHKLKPPSYRDGLHASGKQTAYRRAGRA